MTDGSTLIVDVETLGENSYALSLPAEDLWVAYEVVRRHIDADGVRHYSQMTEAQMTDSGYSFKFDTGDVFTCASHLNKPTSSTLSDTPAGGSGGGGVLLVKANMDGEGNFTSLDKTWKEIHDAGWGVIYYEQGFLTDYDGYQYEPIQLCVFSESDSKYYVASQSAGMFVAASASDYPTATGE